jgi:peptide/nickel transport system ATP-binding protein
MGSIPRIGGGRNRLRQVDGNMPRLNEIPPGCPFNPRCPEVFDRCRRQRPDLLSTPTTDAACWLYDKAHASAENVVDG